MARMQQMFHGPAHFAVAEDEHPKLSIDFHAH
jgi:hypothetical protein